MMRRRILAVSAFLLLLTRPGAADQVAAPISGAGDLCLPAIALAEQAGGLPTHLLRSIAFVESGRADPATGRRVPWPWTINVEGTGYFYDGKDEAVTAVRRFQASGIRSIDVGCAQVNLQHHPAAFASLEAAFDPRTNADYAARFLNTLYRTTGSWPRAAAGYHSMTPDRGQAYAERVMAIWPGGSRYGAVPWERRGTSQPATDYSLLTPAFAALTRRIDADRMRRARPSAAPGLVWISRPPDPGPILPLSRRPVRRTS